MQLNELIIDGFFPAQVGQHAWALVSLLESCLAHSLRPSSKGDPPHAKMASDIMSCVLLNYNKKAVMQLAIPVAVKFLHKGNKELSRNMSSYMSLAAIENADLLAAHLQPILDSVISGNYSLSRVLCTSLSCSFKELLAFGQHLRPFRP